MDPVMESLSFAAWMFWPLCGLCFGSFINVVIHRLPKDLSLIRPRSRCPRCSRPIAFYDNVPILSWILLRGKCRGCGKPIPWRYPLVEALVGAAGFGLWWRWEGQWLWVLAALMAVAALVAITFIDIDEFIIPNELSLGLLVLGIAAAPLNPLFSGSALWKFALSFGSGLAGFLLCWAVAAFGEFVFKKEAMGGGDVKLLAAVGAWSGPLGAFDCLFIASLIGALYGISLIFQGKIRRRDPIPFGPFLAAGAILNFFYLLPFGFPFHKL